MIKAMRIQLARLVHASNLALRKTSIFSKYRRQFREVERSSGDLQFGENTDSDTDGGADTVVDGDVDAAIVNEALEDQLISDERVREMGLEQLLSDALSQPDPVVKCRLQVLECGRNHIEWERGVTGIHVIASPTSGDLVLVHTNRAKDKLRGSKRNGATQKLIVQMGSLWSAWLTTPVGSPARLHLALSSAPACLVRMYKGTEDWVRLDDRRVLEDAATCNIIILHGPQPELRSILTYIRQASAVTKTVPARPMSFRLPALIARVEAHRERRQQKRVSSSGAGLFVRLAKAKSQEDRAILDAQCDVLHRVNVKRWRLYLRACVRGAVPRTHSERVARQFRLTCLSCSNITFWDSRSGIRRGLRDGKSHHFCKLLCGFTSESFKAAPWLEGAFRARVTL